MNVAESRSSRKQRSYLCDNCSKIFTNYKSFEAHIQTGCCRSSRRSMSTATEDTSSQLETSDDWSDVEDDSEVPLSQRTIKCVSSYFKKLNSYISALNASKKADEVFRGHKNSLKVANRKTNQTYARLETVLVDYETLDTDEKRGKSLIGDLQALLKSYDAENVRIDAWISYKNAEEKQETERRNATKATIEMVKALNDALDAARKDRHIDLVLALSSLSVNAGNDAMFFEHQKRVKDIIAHSVSTANAECYPRGASADAATEEAVVDEPLQSGIRRCDKRFDQGLVDGSDGSDDDRLNIDLSLFC